MANEVKVMNLTDYDSSIDGIEDIYVITFNDLHNDYKMYICFLLQHSNFNCDYLNIRCCTKSVTEIASKDKDEGIWNSKYGEIDSVVSLKDLIVTYGEVKDRYTKDDINMLVDRYGKDYVSLKKSDNGIKLVKKL